jgi:hypothetical protein
MSTGTDITAVLADMGEEQFGDFIARRLGPDEPAEVWQVLTSPEVVARTATALAVLLNDVNLQLAAESAKMDSLPRMDPDEYHRLRAGHGEWRSRTLRFKRLADRRLQQAKSAERKIRQAGHASAMQDQGSGHREAVRLLAAAIAAHRQAVIASGVTPEKADIGLWEVLAEVRVPCYGTSVTVAEMLAGGAWDDGTAGRRRGRERGAA